VGLRASFVRGRNKARDARGAPLLDERFDIPEHLKAYVAELEAALSELTQSAGELQARVAELESVATPLAAALLIPGVKAMLVNRFHSDKNPDATAEQYAAYEEAMKVINEAYAVIKKIQAGENQP
jgi:hypothetical protein